MCGLEMRTIDEVKAIDVTFAQPSECAVLTIGGKRTLASVFGRGRRRRNSVERMKLTMRKSARVVLLKELFVDKIGGSIPIVVDAEDWEEHAEELDDLFLATPRCGDEARRSTPIREAGRIRTSARTGRTRCWT